jgi:hypothetical protein
VHGGNAPPACAPECVEYSRADLSGVSLTLYFAPQASVLEAAASSGPPSWQVRRGESPVYLLCNSGAPAPQCVVYDNFGHGSSLTTYLISGKALKPTPSITSDGPAAFVADLNADGYLDATLEQADEDQPGYGYWQTYVFNGRAFVSTGCGGKKKHLGTRPAKPETGSCPR